MEECKYFFKDLVYVDFEDEKIIGEIEGHRITKEGSIFYKVALVNMYVPVTMIHILTKEQETNYYKLMDKCRGNTHSCKENFIKDMQNIFLSNKLNNW